MEEKDEERVGSGKRERGSGKRERGSGRAGERESFQG
jgi:hypothetical protein